ncbi:hypothetical protein [Flagellimonas allohymeniacidonis]|uniref:Uncharacterized protein n=1 Tax=Flagellimonas allohymeniacidonis TaxID=2517819 RepID=A0A4Q8QHJ8_9FLAO|nr:hypothetical protein [Allomuricauda hymeniacidonis]TAI47636.1 hypothetical protein EW142_13310 [Allomuricauda hymeniacidonis]
MAKSTSYFQTQVPFYIKVLENLIDNKDLDEKGGIDSAIFEAKEVAKGNKQVFSIGKEHYYFVTTLLTRYKDNLLDLEGNSFDEETYSGILEILK